MGVADTNLTFSTIAERDVDLVLIEELSCSSSFRRWFLQQVLAGDREATLLKAHHSVCTNCGPGSGESDIELLVETTDGGRVLILIENKIDAPFQPNQGNRYALRAQFAIHSGNAVESYAVLVGPAEYIQERSDGFDTPISYEAIVAHLATTRDAVDGELRDRLQHRICILDHAINRYRRGWCAEPNGATTNLWSYYHERVMREAPELGMERPGPKPANSSFVRFESALPTDPTLPRMVLKHKMSYGNVDIEIATWGPYVREVGSLLQPHLRPNMIVRRAAKSLAITLKVPEIDITQSPEHQAAKIAVGIEAAKSLCKWYKQYLPVLRDCASAIASAARVMST